MIPCRSQGSDIPLPMFLASLTYSLTPNGLFRILKCVLLFQAFEHLIMLFPLPSFPPIPDFFFFFLTPTERFSPIWVCDESVHTGPNSWFKALLSIKLNKGLFILILHRVLQVLQLSCPQAPSPLRSSP